jgi:hypothetical protein
MFKAMITLSSFRQKQRSATSSQQKGNSMKKRSTYRLLVQSEEKNRNVMEIAVYGLVGLSCLISIWQFAEQPNALPLDKVGTTPQEQVEVQIAS